MLIKTTPQALKASLLAGIVGLGLASSPAMAWGDREQGILTGIGATLLLGHIADQSREGRGRHASGYDHPGYSHRSHGVRYDHPGYSGYGGYGRHAPVTVVREVPQTVIIEREIVASGSICREVPVKDKRGRVVEFRQLCD